jgi:hypothetical protein
LTILNMVAKPNPIPRQTVISRTSSCLCNLKFIFF